MYQCANFWFCLECVVRFITYLTTVSSWVVQVKTDISVCEDRWSNLWSSASNHTRAAIVHLLWRCSWRRTATSCSLRCWNTPWRRAPVMHHSTFGECVNGSWTRGVWWWWRRVVMTWWTYNSIKCNSMGHTWTIGLLSLILLAKQSVNLLVSCIVKCPFNSIICLQLQWQLLY